MVGSSPLFSLLNGRLTKGRWRRVFSLSIEGMWWPNAIGRGIPLTTPLVFVQGVTWCGSRPLRLPWSRRDSSAPNVCPWSRFHRQDVTRTTSDTVSVRQWRCQSSDSYYRRSREGTCLQMRNPFPPSFRPSIYLTQRLSGIDMKYLLGKKKLDFMG